MGTADAGHYYSYININRQSDNESSPEWLKTENDKWVEFNDSQIKEYKYKIFYRYYFCVGSET